MKSLDSVRKFAYEIGNCRYVEAAVMFGSVAYEARHKKSISDNFSDVDVIVFLESENFDTPLKAYQDISRIASSTGIIPTVKTTKELGRNYVTMKRGYVEHLRNIGIPLYDDICVMSELDKLWKVVNEPAASAASDIAFMLSVRHDLLKAFCNRIEPLLVKHNPSLAFWHHAVRDFMEIHIEPENDYKLGIVEEFYKQVPVGKVEDVRKLRSKLKEIPSDNDSSLYVERVKSYFTNLKNIIERDAWGLNNWIIENLQSFKSY